VFKLFAEVKISDHTIHMTLLKSVQMLTLICYLFQAA